MATFVSTVKFTDQGLTAIKDTCQRAKSFQTSAQRLGVEVRDILWTLGPFDGLILFDAPDDQTATALMLRLSSAGYVHTQTSPAYRAEEMEHILGKMA
jgi:uncharacterized protein with GYD domain